MTDPFANHHQQQITAMATKKAISLPKLQALVAVADAGSFETAAAQLDVTRPAVTRHINELKTALGVELFEYDSKTKKQLLTPFARDHVLDRARRMVQMWSGISTASRTSCTIAFLPHHAYLISGVLQRPPVVEVLIDHTPVKRPVAIDAIILGEEHRSTVNFQENVLGHVVEGAIDLVIGPPPGEEWTANADLDQMTLYTARLEAMVPVTDPRSELTLGELTKMPLLLPPALTRSRQTLDRALRTEYEGRAHGVPHLDVKYEAIGTKVLVALGTHGHGAVVVPSDIAHPFKHGSYFGGQGSDGHKWIPLRSGDGYLTHDVKVHIRRRNPNPNALRIIDALRAAADSERLDIAKSYPPQAAAQAPMEKAIAALERAYAEAAAQDQPEVAGLALARRLVEECLTG